MNCSEITSSDSDQTLAQKINGAPADRSDAVGNGLLWHEETMSGRPDGRIFNNGGQAGTG